MGIPMVLGASPPATGDRPAGPMGGAGGLATHGQISLHGAIKGHTKPRKRWAAALVLFDQHRDLTSENEGSGQVVPHQL